MFGSLPRSVELLNAVDGVNCRYIRAQRVLWRRNQISRNNVPFALCGEPASEHFVTQRSAMNLSPCQLLYKKQSQNDAFIKVSSGEREPRRIFRPLEIAWSVFLVRVHLDRLQRHMHGDDAIKMFSGLRWCCCKCPGADEQKMTFMIFCNLFARLPSAALVASENITQTTL